MEGSFTAGDFGMPTKPSEPPVWSRRCLRTWTSCDHVLVLTRLEGHGRTSSLEVRTNTADLYHVHDGTVTKIVHYWDRARAFADLGLEE